MLALMSHWLSVGYLLFTFMIGGKINPGFFTPTGLQLHVGAHGSLVKCRLLAAHVYDWWKN